jgi:AcrR family transcriptional regulator
MPPSIKITKEKITSTALEMTRQRGLEAVTPQALAAKLKCSSRPLYRDFSGIEDIRQAVCAEAKKIYTHYIYTELPEHNRFKAIGMNYIRLAKEEPELFKLLFMRAGLQETIGESTIDEHKDFIIEQLSKVYSLSREVASRVYEDAWIYVHGIAALVVTKTVVMDEGEISQRTTNAMKGFLSQLKGGFA